MRLWRIKDHKELCLFQGYNNWAFSVAFSPDGQRIISGSADHTVCVWKRGDQQNFCVERTLSGHSDWTWKVVFSPDGLTLASASGDETIKVWDARLGTCLETFKMPLPYEGMNIQGVSGITLAQKPVLKLLGAVDSN